MKKTKREKNSIILTSLLAIIIFLWFVYLSYSYLYKNIALIEEQKDSFKMIVDEYNKVKKSWLSLKEIKLSLSASTEETPKFIKDFLNEKTNTDMIKKIPQSFYDKNFINTWSSDYIGFLDKKLKTLQSSDLKSSFIETQEKIFTVLPIYSDKANFYTNKSITNFSFISNIENMLRKYNLQTNSELWISSLISVKNSQLNEKNQNLEEGIYYIPLNLKLEWSKKNILNFLDYIQDSWSIKYIDWNLDILNTNQISDIPSLSMKEYIDSSTINEDSSNIIELKDLIKNTYQSQEKFEIDVDLRFYVIWIPAYKVKIEVSKVIWKDSKEDFNYFNIKNRTSKILKQTEKFWESNYRVKQLKNINSYLNEITKDIQTLSSSLNKNSWLEQAFESSQKYKNIFETIDINLTEIQKSLNLK